uniref:acyltransferase n=1 Tax=Gemella haemolysans TaxID=1379 RepID=UPI003F9F18C4
MGVSKKTRDSNIELLRIILMLFIVMHHIISSVIAPGFSNKGFACVDVVLHTAVIIFVLISGYFGINLRIKSLLNLILQVVFYSLSLTLLGVYVFNLGCPVDVIKSLLPISGNYYWFVTVYVELLLLSPFINKLLVNLSNRQYISLLVILGFLIFWFGLLRKTNISIDGKNIVYFIFIYIVGGGIRRISLTDESSKFLTNRFHFFILLLSLMVLGGGYLLPDTHSLFIHFMAYAYVYNSPFLLIMSISIFCLFRNLSFKNRWINYMASSSLAIYLIHEHPLMREVIYVQPFMKLIHLNPYFLFVIVIAFAIIVSVTCMLMDKVRVFLFSLIDKPISLFTNKIENKIEL